MTDKDRERNQEKNRRRQQRYKENPELRKAASRRALELNTNRKDELAELNHTKYKNSRAKWRANNRERILAKSKELYKVDRTAVLDYYGRICNCCGPVYEEFLTVDHINGGGNQHRKAIKCTNMYRWLVKNNFPDGFQLLCWNCNCTKAHLGYCPHELERHDVSKPEDGRSVVREVRETLGNSGMLPPDEICPDYLSGYPG